MTESSPFIRGPKRFRDQGDSPGTTQGWRPIQVHTELASGQPTGLERLSEGDFGGILAAVGNHENKALLFVAMKADEVYCARKLKVRYSELQGDRSVWNISPSTLFDYCSRSLAPLGLVAKEDMDEAGNWGYQKTPLGNDYGDAITTELLLFSLRHPETSLIDIFGRTSTAWQGSDRAPTNRLRLFQELLTIQLPAVPAQLHTSVLGNRYNPGFFDELDRKNVLTLSRRGSNYKKPLRLYTVHKAKLGEIENSKSPLVRNVHKVLATWSSEETIGSNQILDHLGGADLSSTDRRQLLRRITNVVRLLKNRDILELDTQASSNTTSLVDLTDRQRLVLEDLVTTVYRVQDNPGVRTSKDLLLSNPAAFRQLVEKAKYSSTVTSTDERDAQLALVHASLSGNDPKTFPELERLIGGLMSRPALQRRVFDLERLGLVQVGTAENGLRSIRLIERHAENP